MLDRGQIDRIESVNMGVFLASTTGTAGGRVQLELGRAGARIGEETEVEAGEFATAGGGVCGAPASLVRVGAIDIGSRSFKVVLGEKSGGRVATRLLGKRNVKLGAEVQANGGVLSGNKLAEARAALQQLYSLCVEHGAQKVLGVATEAARAASNGEELLSAARRLRIEVELADGKREAEIAYLAAAGGSGDALVCDFGSRSMQWSWKTAGCIGCESVNAGYEVVYQRFIEQADAFALSRAACREFLDETMASVPARKSRLIGLGFNTAACFVTGLEKWQITNRYLYHDLVARRIRALEAVSPTDFGLIKRTMPRASKVLPGLIVLDYLLRRMKLERALIVDAELPTGLVLEYFRRIEESRGGLVDIA